MEGKNNNLTGPASATASTAKNGGEENVEATTKQPSGAKSIASPEGVLILCVAVILDCAGFMLLFLSWLGIDDYGVLDIFGAVIFGTWLFTTRGSDGVKKVLPKFLIAFGIESIPILGSASPSWIVFAYKVLKNS